MEQPNFFSRTTATQYMKHKIGNNTFIIPSMLNQPPMLLKHQPDFFVEICIHTFLDYTKSQSYRK